LVIHDHPCGPRGPEAHAWAAPTAADRLEALTSFSVKGPSLRAENRIGQDRHLSSFPNSNGADTLDPYPSAQETRLLRAASPHAPHRPIAPVRCGKRGYRGNLVSNTLVHPSPGLQWIVKDALSLGQTAQRATPTGHSSNSSKKCPKGPKAVFCAGADPKCLPKLASILRRAILFRIKSISVNKILEILYCTPKGRRALLRIPTTGRAKCLPMLRAFKI
jgi:hypothetical protein